ncbi:MAG: hypothetical protein RL380_331 [Verrucomicrobiota bacterium]|jgi:hypothetical protein
MKIICATIGVNLLMACAAYGQGNFQPLTITFDGLPVQPQNTAYTVHYYQEQGMEFTDIPLYGNGFGRVGSQTTNRASFYADNGTTILNAGVGDSLSFVFANGLPFNLNSVDLAEYSTVAVELYGVFPVHFVGYHADGSTIETDFTPDGIIDGPGGLPDFQTFTFTGWNNLTRVEVPGFDSLDNLVVTPLPEPGTIGLGLVGFAVLAYHLGWRGRGKQ